MIDPPSHNITTEDYDRHESNYLAEHPEATTVPVIEMARRLNVSRYDVMCYRKSLDHSSEPMFNDEMPHVPPNLSSREAYYNEEAEPSSNADDVPIYTTVEVNDIIAGYKSKVSSLERTIKNRTFQDYQANTLVTEVSRRTKDIMEDIWRRHPRPPRMDPEMFEGKPYTLHLPLTDVHYGENVDEREAWGGNYSVEIASERLLRHAHNMVAWINSMPGYCEHLYATDLGDFFQGIDGKTKKGTFIPHDARGTMVLSLAKATMIEYYEILRGACEHLHIFRLQGNHDHYWSYSFLNTIEQYFAYFTDVTVYDTRSPQAYFIVGDPDPANRKMRTAHILDHGVSINKLNTPGCKTKVHTTIANALGDDEATAARKILYCGHLHFHESLAEGGVEVIRLPSTSETNDWETALRVGSTAGAIAYKLDHRGQIEQTKRTHFASIPSEPLEDVFEAIKQRSLQDAV